jgi:hypothetical protein
MEGHPWTLTAHERNNGYYIGIGITFNSEILHSKIEGSSPRFFPFSAVLPVTVGNPANFEFLRAHTIVDRFRSTFSELRIPPAGPRSRACSTARGSSAGVELVVNLFGGFHSRGFRPSIHRGDISFSLFHSFTGFLPRPIIHRASETVVAHGIIH